MPYKENNMNDTKWEYKIVYGIQNEKTINQLGCAGWELVSVVYDPGRCSLDYYFKRRLDC